MKNKRSTNMRNENQIAMGLSKNEFKWTFNNECWESSAKLSRG